MLFEKWHAHEQRDIKGSSPVQVAQLEMVGGNVAMVASFEEEGGCNGDVPRWGSSEGEESTRYNTAQGTRL